MSQFCIPSKLPRRVSRSLQEQNVFCGLEDPTGATGDKCRCMKNISPVSYPSLSVRQGWTRYKHLLANNQTPYGIIYHEGILYIAASYYLYAVENGALRQVALLSEGEKHMVSMNGKIYIFPDRMVYDPIEKTCRSLTISTSVSSGVSFAQNIITCTGMKWETSGFAIGDGVRIVVNTALTSITEEGYYIIVGMSGEDLILDRPVITGSYGIRVDRLAPRLTNVCVWQNRLWGYDGEYLYACAKNNPYHWLLTDQDIQNCGEIFEGEDAPVCMTSATPGDFETITAWQDYLVLFKQDRVCKLFGSRAGQYTLSELSAVGVAHEEGGSLCEVAGRLYYLSGHGVFSYDGGYPMPSVNIPDVKLSHTVGGSDGRCYYLCGQDETGMYTLYAYDPESQGWFTQENVAVKCMTRQNHTLWMLTYDGELIQTQGKWGMDTIWQNGTQTNIALQAEVTFCDEVGCIVDGLRLHQLYLSCHSGENCVFRIKIAYDGDETYREIATLQGAHQGWLQIPMPKVRCKYYHLKFEIAGDLRIYALHRAYEKGGQS